MWFNASKKSMLLPHLFYITYVLIFIFFYIIYILNIFISISKGKSDILTLCDVCKYSALTSEIFIRSWDIVRTNFMRTDGQPDGHGLIDFSFLHDQEYMYVHTQVRYFEYLQTSHKVSISLFPLEMDIKIIILKLIFFLVKLYKESFCRIIHFSDSYRKVSKQSWFSELYVSQNFERTILGRILKTVKTSEEVASTSSMY